jgi:transposase
MDSDEIYPYGWAPLGKRCEAQKQGNRATRERINLVAGLKQDALLAPVIFSGYCDGNFFLEWIKVALIPELAKGDVVIPDNAPFHPAEKITELLQSAGFNTLFLPRYSPRDNKIEHRWFPIKNATRKILATYTDITAALHAVIIAN